MVFLPLPDCSSSTTVNKSIFYKYPLLYTLGLKLIHKKNFSQRYRYMASFVKKGDFVLEPACGPANLADFLPSDSHYIGFDTNEDFIRHALSKKRDVFIGNVLSKKNYRSCDVVITCDILHHLKPSNRKTFIKHCFSSARRLLIICEPFEKKQNTKSIFYPIKKYLTEWSERDGTSNVKMHYFFSHRELSAQIKSGFGAIPSSVKRETKEIGDDIIGVFIKTGR